MDARTSSCPVVLLSSGSIMLVLDDARGSIIQWPQTQIMLDQVAYLNNKYLSLHSNHSFGILENCTNFDTDTTR